MIQQLLLMPGPRISAFPISEAFIELDRRARVCASAIWGLKSYEIRMIIELTCYRDSESPRMQLYCGTLQYTICKERTESREGVDPSTRYERVNRDRTGVELQERPEGHRSIRVDAGE